MHGPRCECKEREQRTEKAGDDELVAWVLAVARGGVVRERVEGVRRVKERVKEREERKERAKEREERKRERRERMERSKERRKRSVFGWRVEIPREVTRFFGGGGSTSTTSLSESGSDNEREGGGAEQHKITDLCLACASLDIDKIVAHLFTNMVPVNGRCTITSSESESQPAETTPLLSVLRSPLFATRPKSQIAMLRLLLDLGADPNASVSILPLTFESTDLSGHAQPSRITILSAASILGMAEAVTLLLERGAKIDARETKLPLCVDGRYGKALSALDVAIMGGQERVAEVLLRGGATVTATCELFLPAQFPMKLAGTIGGRPKARLRSASTANLHTRLQPQQQPQQWQEPQWPAPLPVSRKTTRLSGMTPLHLASISGHLGIASMIMSSPYSKADVNARASNGHTPLHYAAETLNLEVSSLLLSDPRTDTDATDDDGATAFSLLVGKLESNRCTRQNEHVVELIRRLMRAGANPSVRYGTDLSLKARLLAMDGPDMKWAMLFEEDGRGVLRGSMKRRTF